MHSRVLCANGGGAHTRLAQTHIPSKRRRRVTERCAASPRSARHTNALVVKDASQKSLVYLSRRYLNISRSSFHPHRFVPLSTRACSSVYAHTVTTSISARGSQEEEAGSTAWQPGRQAGRLAGRQAGWLAPHKHREGEHIAEHQRRVATSFPLGSTQVPVSLPSAAPPPATSFTRHFTVTRAYSVITSGKNQNPGDPSRETAKNPHTCPQSPKIFPARAHELSSICPHTLRYLRQCTLNVGPKT